MMHGRVKNIVMWALTYRCNMSCEYCFLRDKIKNRRELSDDECIKVARFLAEDVTFRPDAVWLTGGEPTVKHCLPELIRILEGAGIRCVVTSNGFCSETVLDRLLEAAPRGINISLESTSDEVNGGVRGYTQAVVETVRRIAERKHPHTMLGISCVVSQENMNALPAFSRELKALGVEYLSINPLIGNESAYRREELTRFTEILGEIKRESGLILPGDYYFHLLASHLSGQMPLLKCPAGDHFFFLSPWGKCYPCSNELWQSGEDTEEAPGEKGSTAALLSSLRAAFHTDTLTTKSPCFGDRCIGCWKLYYDTVFT